MSKSQGDGSAPACTLMPAPLVTTIIADSFHLCEELAR